VAGTEQKAEPELVVRQDEPTEDNPTGQWVPMAYAGEFREVPASKAAEAVAGGFRPLSKEEADQAETTARFRAEHSELEQGAAALASGVATGALGLPGLVMGKSGGELLTDLASVGLEENQRAETARELRAIHDSSNGLYFAGEVAGSLLGSGGSGAAARAGLAAAKGSRLAAALGGTIPRAAGVTAENIGQSVAMANNDAFVSNRELTSETAMLAAMYGGFGPLAFKAAMTGGRITGGKLAGLLDDARGASGKPGAVQLKKLFGAREEALETLGQLATDMEQKAMAARGLVEKIGTGAGAAGRKEFKRAIGMDYLGNMRGRVGAAKRIAYDAILGPIAGSFAGNAANKLGMKAAGMFFNASAAGFRGLAQRSAKALTRGPRVSPAGVVVDAMSRSMWRDRVNTVYENEIDGLKGELHDRQGFVDAIGANFGEFTNAGMIPALSKQYATGMKFLIDEMPPSVAQNPAMPQLGYIRPPLEQQEGFLRKLNAVRNPLVLLEQLEDGEVDQDTVRAVSSVYPTLYLDMVQEVTAAMASETTPLDRHRMQVLDTFLGGQGVAFVAQAPRYMAQLEEARQAVQVQHGDQQGNVSKQGRPTGSPTMSQQRKAGTSYKTASQSSTENIYNQ